jgi:hypothetical protein
MTSVFVKSASNLMPKMSNLMHFKNCTRNLPQYRQITIISRDAINLIWPLHVHAKTENLQIKKKLVVSNTHYIYILFAFIILNTFWLTEDFISGLLYNRNRKNTKLGIKGWQFLRRSADN